MNNNKVSIGIFGIVPISLIQDPTITRNEIIVYAALASFQGTNDECFPYLNTIGERCCIKNLKTISTTITNLVKKGWVIRKRQGLGKPNIYRVLFDYISIDNFTNTSDIQKSQTSDFQKTYASDFQKTQTSYIENNTENNNENNINANALSSFPCGKESVTAGVNDGKINEKANIACNNNHRKKAKMGDKIINIPEDRPKIDQPKYTIPDDYPDDPFLVQDYLQQKEELPEPKLHVKNPEVKTIAEIAMIVGQELNITPVVPRAEEREDDLDTKKVIKRITREKVEEDREYKRDVRVKYNGQVMLIKREDITAKIKAARKWYKERNPSYYHDGKQAKCLENLVKRCIVQTMDLRRLLEKHYKLQEVSKYYRNLPLTPAITLAHYDKICAQDIEGWVYEY